MRVYLHLTPNQEIVPFNYQQKLVGAFHKWLGENELHDDISLYSLSWLGGGKMRRDKRGFDFRHGARFFISSPLEALHTKAVSGIFKYQDIAWGMKVSEVTMRVTPDFGEAQCFKAQSPILIKRNQEDSKHQRYYYPQDPESSDLLTETLQSKLARLSLPTDVRVRFDPDYRNPRSKLVQYRDMNIKATFCPVIVEGDARAVQFAWEVGVGNSTGIGFGALV